MSTKNNDFDNDKQFGKYLRAHATRFEASQKLHDFVRTQSKLGVVTQPSTHETRLIGGNLFSWRSATAGLMSGVALTLAVGLISGPQIQALVARPSLETGLVSRHVYSMGHGPLFDVVSSDRHTVKPWFQGRLDFSPPVPDLASAGFALQGGRVDHVNGRAVAALAYRYKQHIINAFVWPSEKAQSTQLSLRKGFNLLHWDDGLMQIWLVSDMDAKELYRFSQAWREQTANNPSVATPL